MTAATRRRLNLSIPENLIAEARKAKLNLSRFLEEKLEELVRSERARRWQDENKEAINAYNARIERQGLHGDVPERGY